jgi:cellulose synthase/poly-beta-1,6-N-acetylglucosamine synthase-like glycosyltransferase
LIGLWILFWAALTCVGYTYVGYPLLAGVAARLRARPVTKGRYGGSFSILLACHNEESNIVRRIEELRRFIAATGLDGELLVIADGCTDRTTTLVDPFVGDGGPSVRLLSWPENRGKAAALSAGAAEARGDILVFADARQTWADDALAELLSNFADPQVGGVSGDLVLESAPGVLAGVGLYWRFEKWLRRQESRRWSQVGVTGAIAAGRRQLFRPIPPGTLLDDVYWPLAVAMQGYRVVHDETARASDRLPDTPRAEFRRKVRTLAGNLQLAARLPASLLPWRNPVWLAWLSHKLARLVVPWALLVLAIVPVFLGGPWMAAFLAAQGACYALALAGLLPGLAKLRIAGAATSFLVLNAAAWCGFWVWALGRTRSAWSKVRYQPTDERRVEVEPVVVSTR